MPLCSSCSVNIFTPRVVADLPGLHNKLRTEYGPAFVQPDEVTSILQDIQRDIEDYETKFHCLECREREKERLEEYAVQLQSLLSPCRKIPNEILQEIFDLCCDMNTFRVVDPAHRVPMHESQALRSKPAMAISSVCSRWRSNALFMPAIWSRISLEWKMNAALEHTTLFFPLYNFLNRSQHCPMTVKLDVKGHPFLKSGRLCPPLRRFFSQMGRWKELAYYHNEHNGSYAMTDLLNRCDGLTSVSFPILSKLCMSASMARTDLFNLFFSSRAPKLRDMALGYTFFDRPIRFNPRSRITHMDFIPGEADIQNLFKNCPKLLSLGMPESWQFCKVVPPMITSSSTFSSTCSPTLETLTVRHGYWTPAPSASNSVFPTLRLPSLKALHLEKSKSRWMLYDVYAEGKPWSNFEPFMAFVKQSFSQLTTFSIQKLYISDANLVCILEHLPTLQDLTVDDDDISPERSPISVEFVESLHGYVSSFLRPQESPIVPRLRSLKLLNVAATTFRDLSVVNMVQSRWRPTRLHEVGTCARVDCLREFIMIFRKRLEDDAGSVYSALALFEEEGMRVVVGQSDEA